MSAREFIVLGRQWCHLCDVMIDGLRPLAEEFGWSVRVLDVDADPVLLEKWDELVPVLLADGRELCHYHLDEAAVCAHVAEFG